ncbi:hypothetical protein OF001_U30028 [Pseudomonas sp. OF001]|nr:hypothetical protein OF001_U30028 [Pseudomonas sp. OF001]
MINDSTRPRFIAKVKVATQAV